MIAYLTAAATSDLDPETVLFSSSRLYLYSEKQLLPNTSWVECVALAQLRNPRWLHWTPQIHSENCPLSFDDYCPQLTHLSLDRPYSPLQTASGSRQAFCHSTVSGQTDTQTHRVTNGLGDVSVRRALMLATLIESDALKRLHT